MPRILSLSSILHAPLSHHHPATCFPSRLAASATPTPQGALLDQEVPISSQVRMSFQTSWLRQLRFLPGPGVRCQFCVPPPACSYRLNCWTGWIWNVISCDCHLVLTPNPFDGCSSDLRVVVIPLLEVPGWDFMLTVRGKLRSGAGVTGRLLPEVAHPSFWYCPQKRALARPKRGTSDWDGQGRDL